jgi:hypothetical protein
MLQSLEERVGGADALDTLDADPLPDETFPWAAIPPDIQGTVGAILELSDTCCEEHFDIEMRTACRRVLAKVAEADPAIFRRRAKIENAAAAIGWITAKLNGLYGGRLARLHAKDHMAYFGVSGSAGSQRAATMVRALGNDGFGWNPSLGDAGLLLSTTRADIIELRDRYQRQLRR